MSCPETNFKNFRPTTLSLACRDLARELHCNILGYDYTGGCLAPFVPSLGRFMMSTRR
jgi:hypothetical protein